MYSLKITDKIVKTDETEENNKTDDEIDKSNTYKNMILIIAILFTCF